MLETQPSYSNKPEFGNGVEMKQSMLDNLRQMGFGDAEINRAIDTSLLGRYLLEASYMQDAVASFVCTHFEVPYDDSVDVVGYDFGFFPTRVEGGKQHLHSINMVDAIFTAEDEVYRISTGLINAERSWVFVGRRPGYESHSDDEVINVVASCAEKLPFPVGNGLVPSSAELTDYQQEVYKGMEYYYLQLMSSVKIPSGEAGAYFAEG